ncbi:hypothetical protein BC332_14649 [Capsicum chinense]|nr:hypothetical protein BC332_14649 [Capsicum chinense]
MHREIESNIRCYEPLVVSIGPFHRGKPELQLMEKRKELLAIQFADQDSTKERPEGVLPWLLTNSVSIGELYKKVKNIMPNVKVCYDDELIKKCSHEEFAQMMLLDGCFILQSVEKKGLHFLGLPAHLLELLKTHLIDPNAFSEGGCYLRALLTLPPLTIDDSTKSEFLNLVAYETRPDTPDEFGITSYLTFMDSLIDHAEDVKELRSKGILLNSFGTDEEVANLFKEIAQNLVPNPHAFFDAKLKIEQQYSSRRKAWIAELKNTHFAGPWTFLAFIAALFVIALQVAGLVLSAFQTYYAGHDKKGCIPNDLTKQGKPMTLSKLMSSLSISPSNNPDFHRLTPIVVRYGLLILQKHEDNNVDDGDDGDWFRNEDPNAFYTAYGDLFWSKLSRDTSSGNWFHANMARDSQSFINVLIGNEFKDVFKGLTSLVDVGGEMVMLQWP